MKEYQLKRWRKEQCSNGTDGRLAEWEWLDCNSLGSHASSSWLQVHTRKYHGLLVAALPNFDDRWMILNSLEESVITGDKKTECFLDGHYYPGVDMSKDLTNYLDSVEARLDGHQCWRYVSDGWQVAREEMLMRGQNSVLLRYAINNVSDRPIYFRIRPLLAIRNFHQLQRASDNAVYCTSDIASGACFKLSNNHHAPSLYLQSSLEMTRCLQDIWYYNILYPKERERGYDYTEDLFCPEYWEYCFYPGKHELLIVGGTEAHDSKQLSGFWHQELANRMVDRMACNSDLISVLRAGADKFIVKQQEVATKIIAGYPWFLSWGRDTMISLPGLAIYNGRMAAARSILTHYAKWLRDGLLPNYLGATVDHHAYNSADASLWWVWAVYHYWLATGCDSQQILKLWGSILLNIWCHYTAATCYNIRVDDTTGLLYVGSADWNLTWMDARIDGKPVTPRYGYAVELNALWYHFICFLSKLISAGWSISQDDKELLARQIEKFRANFIDQFWYAEGGYLYDYFNEHEHNHQLRPNQLWAVALAYDLFEDKKAKTILEVVDRQLFTPYGLRTLDTSDAHYHGKCRGTQIERDAAYHNGTVWPWLLGCFFESALKCLDAAYVNSRWQECLQGMSQHLLNEECIGGISEIFDGDTPHASGGTVDQAWSVGELLRVAHMLNSK